MNGKSPILVAHDSLLELAVFQSFSLCINLLCTFVFGQVVNQDFFLNVFLTICGVFILTVHKHCFISCLNIKCPMNYRLCLVNHLF